MAQVSYAMGYAPRECPVCGSVGVEQYMVEHILHEHEDRLLQVTVTIDSFPPGDPAADAPGQARRGDVATARAAALAAEPRSGSQRYRVLRCIGRAANGATAHEIARATGIPYRSVTPRIGELKRGDWVRPSGETRRSDMGSDVEVLEWTDRARLHFRDSVQSTKWDPNGDPILF